MKIKFRFFGKNCVIDRALAERKNLLQNLEEQGLKSHHVLLLNQIHGKEVVVVDDIKKIYGEQDLPKADAIVTNLQNIAIGVVTADCSPILLMDEEKNIIAAAHAGWRGAKLGVISSVVEAMKNLGSKNIKAIIGPMIQQNSYEISQEFFDDFLIEDADNKEFFLNSSKPGHYLFDLPRYVEKKLKEVGVEKIENSGIDTYKNEESFFSFRRSSHRKEMDCGRNVSVIVMN
jgi:YfiH family protein